NNLLCTYTIDKKDPNYCRIELFFDDFEVLPSADCKDDYLQINGKRFCGTTLHGSKQVVDFGSSNSINLLFKTNEIGNGKGFSMKYTQLKCGQNGQSTGGGQEPIQPKKEPTEEPIGRQMCDYSYHDKSFTIHSENISNMYPNNLHCNYVIKKNTSSVCYLEFTFLKFDVEASPQCQFDYLEVNNVRLCGSLQKETTRTYIFEEPEKVVKFHSDASTNRDGYVIQVDQLECQGDAIIRSSTTSTTTAVTNLPYFPSVPSTQSCDQTYVGHEFEITSPQYPNSYPLSSDCMFVIQKLNPNICRLEVTYYDFTLQSPDMNGYCKYDFLDFNGIRMCGDVQKGSVRSYYFPENNFNVRFHSDALYTAKDKGFRIAVRQNECGNSVTGPDTPRDTDKRKCDQIFTKTTFELK
ncbi:cubilin-like protein, partial [Leptotrombidium deliense]